MNASGIPSDRIRDTTNRIRSEAEASGYRLNPDTAFVEALVESLLVNEARYGYWACPCRLADGSLERDRDIVCPCDYRDEDLLEWNACYCGLYVSQAIANGSADLKPVPERRAPQHGRILNNAEPPPSGKDTLWRCSVCGYLCSRPHPPEVCPICNAKQDRFLQSSLGRSSQQGKPCADAEVVIVLLAGPTESCRAMHAFLWVLDLSNAGVNVSLVFEGQSPAWLPLLVDPSHPQHSLYNRLKEREVITGVCRACAANAGVVEDVEEQGIHLLDAASGHASLQPFVKRGATVITL